MRDAIKNLVLTTTLALFALIAFGVGSPLHAQFVSDLEKTDSLRLRNGDWVVGDLRDMALGIVDLQDRRDVYDLREVEPRPHGHHGKALSDLP